MRLLFRVQLPMAPIAERRAIADFKAQLRVILEALDMVSMEFYTRRSAICALSAIARDHFGRPLGLLQRGLPAATPGGIGVKSRVQRSL